MNLQIDISSSGYLAQTLQAPVSRILDAASRLGIQPNRVNGVPYFSSNDVERIREALMSQSQPTLPVCDQRSNIS